MRKRALESPRLQKFLWSIDLLVIGGLVKSLQFLPVDFASRSGRKLGRLLGPTMKRRCDKMRANLRKVLPSASTEQLDALVRECWGNAGAILAEYPHLLTICETDQRLQIDIREPIETYTSPEKPAVFVTAHLSNWELVAGAISKLGIPSVCLYTPPHNPGLNQILLDSRQALNCQLVARDDSMRPLVKAMRQGRSVAMVMDRRIDAGAAVPFFGEEKLTSLLPARLALKFNCDLVPVQTERLHDANYRVTFHPPIKARNTEAGAEEQAIDLACQVNEEFEQWIKAKPEDWFCSKRLWSKAKLSTSTAPLDQTGAAAP